MRGVLSKYFQYDHKTRTHLSSVPGGNHLVLELADVFPLLCEWIDARTLNRVFKAAIAQLCEAQPQSRND